MRTASDTQITIDERDSRPVYRQVADGIKELIARGALGEGMALPSVRQLAGDLGVNMNTIASAYRELQSEGLVAVRHGSGAIVMRRDLASDATERGRRALRAALTELLLSGMPGDDIKAVVSDELAGLSEGT